MLSKEVLKMHYAEYASQSDEWVQNMKITKKSIINQVLKQTHFKPNSSSIKILVLGASDKRYLPIHKNIFQSLIHQPIEIKTFDIDTEHLGGESENIITHNITQPFPDAPFTIIFSHELMKFLTPEEQFETIKNSYRALDKKGLAMHIMHDPSIKGTEELKKWQYRVDPDKLIEQLTKIDIPTDKLVFNSRSDVNWLRETTAIVLRAN